MILNYENLENNIEISTEYISVVEVENKALFLSLVAALYNGDGYNEKRPFTLYEKDNDKIIKNSNSFCFITDLLNIDLNNRKIIKSVLERLTARCLDDEILYQKINNANITIYTAVCELLNEYNVDFSISSEWDTAKYLKAFNFRVDEYETEDILNKLFQYVSICSEFVKSAIICIINLKSYLKESEIKEFYKFVLYNKVQVLLFESNVDNRTFSKERKLIIDSEFDEFINIC